MHRIVTLSLALAGVALLASAAKAEEKKTPAIELFNGRDLGGWEFLAYRSKAKMADVWSVRDGLLICRGEPLGYLATKRKFKDFRLIAEWRWAPGKEPGNSGVLLRITGRPVSFLPRCLEAQLKSGSAGDLWAFHGFKCKGAKDRFKSVKGHEQLGDFLGIGKIKANENPPGQWNNYEITLRGGNLTLAVNGKKTNEATGCDQVAGPIGLQSEGAEIHFRTVKLIPLD